MIRRILLLSSAALLTLGSLAGFGCGSEVAPALVVMGQTVPDDTCVVKAQGGAQQAFLSFGILDLSLGDQYVGYLMIANNFPEYAGLTGAQANEGTLDPSDILLHGMEVTLRIDQTLLLADEVLIRYGEVFGQAPVFPLNYSVPAAGSVPNGGSSAIIAAVIPQAIGSVLRAVPEIANGDTVIAVAEISVLGFRQDGLPITSGKFYYPVHLCNNCLVDHIYDEALALNPFNPPDPDDALDLSAVGTVCVPGQDERVSNAFCGATWGMLADDACALNRCLGKGGDAGLVCANDGKVWIAPELVVE